MPDDAIEWDTKVAKTTGWCHFLQSAEWAEAQQLTSWQPLFTELGDYPLALYNRQVPAFGQLWLSSKIATLEPDQVVNFTKSLREVTGQALAVKIDIDQPYSEALDKAMTKAGWLVSPSIQYRETVILDLTKGREELLKSFKKRARWEINAGTRRGIKVAKVTVTPENMQTVYELLSQTYERANFYTRGRGFTEKYWQAFDKTGHGSMYIASLDDKPLSAAYVIHIGDRAFYKDGASIRVKPDVFASRVMQWQIIQDLIEAGYKQYDLCGVSTKPGTELYGVTLFKTGFGEPVRLQWGYELPLSNRYKMWKKVGERLALKHSATFKKELWY